MDLDQHRRVASESATPSRDEVEDEDDDSEHQQKMNESAGYVEGEAQKPQNQYDDKDCPEHKSPISASPAPESWKAAQAPAMQS
jgi:hypothetical protein